MSLVILISGTSRGLGKHLRSALEARGHTVYGSSRSGSPQDPRHLTLDVTEPEACRAAVDQVLAEQGRLDVVVNNAGSHLLGASTETRPEELYAQMQLNFFGAVHLTQAALPTFLAQSSGRVLNVSSAGGRLGTPYTSAYSASKFALEGYMESLRYELLPHNVFVTNLTPGFLHTGTTDVSVHTVTEPDPKLDHIRTSIHEHMLSEASRGLDLTRVSDLVARVLTHPHPALRYSVDGLTTRLLFARALTPRRMFERMVISSTAPALLT